MTQSHRPSTTRIASCETDDCGASADEIIPAIDGTALTADGTTSGNGAGVPATRGEPSLDWTGVIGRA